MDAVFLKILNMSLSASVVIIAVLLVRLLLRKAPKKWSYLLWGVVGFRLCCPVSFRSMFSIFSLAPLSPATQTSGIEYILRDVRMMAQPRVNIGTQQISEAVPSSLPVAEPSASVNPLQICIAVGVILWCVGIAALLVYGFISYIRMRRRLADAVLVRDNIYETDGIRTPFILGLFQPKIYLPIGLGGDTLRYVLAHEQYHIKRKDYLVKIFAFLLLTVHWFNPLVWLAFYLMGRDMEMSCDEKVLSRENGIAKAYSISLLSFAEKRRFPSPSPLAFGETDVKRRIKNVLNWKMPKIRVTLAAAIFCVAVIAACGTNPADAPADAAPSQVVEEAVTPSFTLNGTEYPHSPLLRDFLDRGWTLDRAIETTGGWSEETGPTDLIDTGYLLTAGSSQMKAYLNADDRRNGLEPAACGLRSMQFYGKDVESFALHDLELTVETGGELRTGLGDPVSVTEMEYGETWMYSFPEDSVLQLNFLFLNPSEPVHEFFIIFGTVNK